MSTIMSITKRIYCGKPQYRYQVGYTDLFGNHKRKSSKWYDSKKECKKAESEFRTDLFLQKTGYTFEEIAENYIEYSTKTNTPHTIHDKKVQLRTHLQPLLKDQIDDITPAKIKLTLERESVQKLSTSRKNRILGLANSVFKHAQIFYGLKINPCDQIPRFKKNTEERMRKMNIYTIKEFNTFLDAISDTREVYKSLFYVLYWTGMRLNEANSLTFEDITPNKINLYRQWKDNSWVPLKTDGSVRKIPIDKDIYSVFENLKKHYSAYPGFSDSWFCFGGYRQLPYTSIVREKDNAVQMAGLHSIRIHDFRHSHASNLIEAGVNMYKISKRLGHSSISITMDRYGHLIDEDGDEVLGAIKNKK